MAKLYGLNSAVDFAAKLQISLPTTFSRTAGQPVDYTQIWYPAYVNDLWEVVDSTADGATYKSGYERACNYATTVAAYVGQELAVIDVSYAEDGTTITGTSVKFYGIQDANGTLKELGAIPVGDNTTINVDETGKISVIIDGEVEDNNTGLVTGGQVQAAITDATKDSASNADLVELQKTVSVIENAYTTIDDITNMIIDDGNGIITPDDTVIFEGNVSDFIEREHTYLAKHTHLLDDNTKYRLELYSKDNLITPLYTFSGGPGTPEDFGLGFANIYCATPMYGSVYKDKCQVVLAVTNNNISNMPKPEGFTLTDEDIINGYIKVIGPIRYSNHVEFGAQENKIEVIKVNGATQTITDKIVDITVPTKVSQLTNDSGFLTTAPEYSIVKDATSVDYAAVYHLTKDGTPISGATINIPKDMMVQSGTVSEIPEVKYTAYPKGYGSVWQSDFFYVGGSPEDEPQSYDPVEGDKLVAGENSFGWTEATYKINDNDGHGYWYTSNGEIVTPEERDTLLVSGQTAGTYIVLTLANANNDKIYVNVGNLIEYVTSGSAGTDMVVISIDSDHKVTATITDGTITKAKLDTTVQDSLDLADSALQKSDIADLVKDQHTHTNKTVLDNITAELVSQWSKAEVNIVNDVSSEFKIVNDADSSKDRVLEIAQIAAAKIVTGTDSSKNPITLDDTITAITDSIEAIYKAGEGENPDTGILIDKIGTLPTFKEISETKTDETGKEITITKEVVDVEGTGIYANTYTRKEIELLIADITGGESAADVLAALNTYKGTNDKRVKAIEDAAITGITVDGTAVTVTDNIAAIELPIATESTKGVVKSSTAENKVSVDADGIMEVKSLNVNKLVQTTGQWLILNGGNASLSETPDTEVEENK